MTLRQATFADKTFPTGEDVGSDPLAVGVSVVILTVVIVGGLVVTASALRRFQLRTAD